MTDAVAPDELEARLAELTYPVTRADAAAAFADVVVATEGEPNLGRLISETPHDAFREPEALATAVEDALGE